MEKYKLIHCLVQTSKEKDAWLKIKRLATPLSDDTEDHTQQTINTLPSQNNKIRILSYVIDMLAAELEIDKT